MGPAVKGLRHALTAAAVLDGALGLPLLVAPRELAHSVGLVCHQDTALRLVGLLLVALAGCVGYAAQDPFRYVGNWVVSVATRTAGAFMLLVGSATVTTPGPLLALGLAELTLAVVQAWLGRDLFRGLRRR